MKLSVPLERIEALNEAPLNPDGPYVLYWMTAQRRSRFNFALQHAVHLAESNGKALVILEALRCDYPWSSPRLHRFVLEGMRDNQERINNSKALYYPFVEEKRGQGKGLLTTLAQDAFCVVTDNFPCFFLPRMVQATAQRIPVQLLHVDSNGILPLERSERVFTTAASFRRHAQKELLGFLAQIPVEEPLNALQIEATPALIEKLTRPWPATDILAMLAMNLETLPLQHSTPTVSIEGGAKRGETKLGRFIHSKLGRYHLDRNAVEDSSASGLSPYLHFGHLSAHEIVLRTLAHCDWSEAKASPKATGSRQGWWGLPEGPEAFLDQIITWRELSYVFCAHRLSDYDQLSSLPRWAIQTIDAHRGDARPFIYSPEELEYARTHDPIWNAAQRELTTAGRMHNYLRMLWAKKIYEWSPTPEQALELLIDLNNRYALDGRNPNSYGGIFWTLGRFDRAWGPERPIYGKLRYMTSQSTARKLKLKNYLQRYSQESLSY